jgi:iron(III) transport system substrate-binding protein
MNNKATAAARRARRTKRSVVAGGVALLAALAGCSSAGSSGVSAAGACAHPSSISAPVLSTLTGTQRSQTATLICQAKSESSFTWIDSVVAPATAAAMIKEFQQQYGLSFKLNYNRLTSGELSTQIQQQVTASKINTDFFGTSSPELFSELKDSNALLHYTSPESSHYTYAAKYVSEQPGYWIAPVAYAFAIVVNPAVYSKPLTSWSDLSDAALKGKVDMPNVAANEGSLYWYYGLKSVLPASVFHAWASNDPKTSSGSSAQEVQKVAEQQIAVAVTAGFRVSQTVAQTKVPLKVYYPSQGTVLDGQTYGILANSPDPAIAELFDDFLLSKAGQQIYVDKEGIASFYTGVNPPSADLAYQPAISSMSIISLNTDKVSSADLTNARNDWKSIFSQ